MSVKPYIVQRRMMELGRVRLGEKGSKGEPKKLQTLRFTSASKSYLDAIAEQHGGTVRPWVDAPEEGIFEVTTKATQIDIILPPVFSAADGSPSTAFYHFFEMWSAGGCMRRCDGETESAGKKSQPCLCNPEERDCKLTTRVSFMIPDVPGLGVWRLESHGYNAAVELPGTLEVLLLAAAEHKFIPAVLRIEPRTKKVPGEGTRRFVVPVIELPGVTVRQLASGEVPLAINAPPARGVRPELPAGPTPPVDASFENGQAPAFGEPPALPHLDSPAAPPPVAGDDEPGRDGSTTAPAPPVAMARQKKQLDALVEALRAAGHITVQHLYRATRHEEIPGDDGELHWEPLRDSLSKDEANDLIERLSRLEENVKAPRFEIPESARTA